MGQRMASAGRAVAGTVSERKRSIVGNVESEIATTELAPMDRRGHPQRSSMRAGSKGRESRCKRGNQRDSCD